MGAFHFFEDTVHNNGATHNVKTKVSNPTWGYFVSIPQHEQKVSLKDFTLKTISDFVEVNKEVLDSDTKFLGSWIDNGIVYLDVTERILDKRLAIRLAYDRGQKAIFDANLGVVIELPSPQTSGTFTQQKAYITSVINKLCSI